MNYRMRAILVLVPFFVLIFYSTWATQLGNAGGATSFPGSNVVNPAWLFQNSIYGRNTTGSYQNGITKVSYTAVFTPSREIFRAQIPGESHVETFVVFKDPTTGSFAVSNPADPSYTYVINSGVGKRNSSSSVASTSSTSASNPTWMYGVTDVDSYTYNVVGAYVYYAFNGGNYPSTSTLLALWLGETTNTNYFMQATVAWGSVNCNQVHQNPPIFSIGYGANLKNCPIAKVVQGDAYVLQISFDIYLTGKWYIEIYDETIQSTITNTAVGNANQGTYIPCCNLGVILEGSQRVDGTYIPNQHQVFYNFVYWDAYYTYNWINWRYYTSSNPSPPSNIKINVNKPSGYIGTAYWCYTGSTCPTS